MVEGTRMSSSDMSSLLVWPVHRLELSHSDIVGPIYVSCK
jgi:hypothetical protein